MRIFLIVFFILLSNFRSSSQNFVYDVSGYNNVAKHRVLGFLKEDSISIKKHPKYVPILVKSRVDKIQFVSIPVYYLKSVRYACLQNIDTLVIFQNDSLYQEILITRKNRSRVLSRLNIVDSFESRQYDNYKKEYREYIKHGVLYRTIYPETNRCTRRVLRRMIKRPEERVFRISDMYGYWVFKNNKLIKLENRFWGLKEVDGSYYVCSHYGEEAMSDVIKESGLKIGGFYKSCDSCKILKITR